MKNAASTSLSVDKTASPSVSASSEAAPLSAANVIYNSQAANLVFACGIVFKVSSLPGLVYSEMMSDTLWLYIFMVCLDALCLAAAFLFAKSGADAVLTEKNNAAYRAVCLLLSGYITLKGFVYFVYTEIFLMVDLFVGVAPYIVVIVLALPVVYLGCKGVRGIARCAELLAPFLLTIIVLNLAFLETDLDAGRNLPLYAMPTEEFFRRGLRFGLWLGDFFPLLFVAVKNKKFPYIAVGAGISYSLVIIVALLAVAMYGGALPYVYNMLIRIAGFNQLSLEIGRLEWAALLVVIVMAVLGLSLQMWGAAESCRRATGTPVPARLVFAASVVVIPLAVPTVQDIVAFSMTDFGYVMLGLSLFFAAAFTVFALFARRSRAVREKLGKPSPSPAAAAERADVSPAAEEEDADAAAKEALRE